MGVGVGVGVDGDGDGGLGGVGVCLEGKIWEEGREGLIRVAVESVPNSRSCWRSSS